jgi:Ca2+-binding EF-hand superfamily protein
LFGHLDKDKGGNIDKNELFKALKAIKQFDSITMDEIDTLFDQLDSDKSGDISIQEFKTYIGEASPRAGSGKTGQRSRYGRDAYHTSENLGTLRKILLNAINNPSNPLTVEKIFRNADGDKSGALGIDELSTVLQKFKTFKDVSKEEINEMMRELDVDGSNEISLEEFKQFLYPTGGSDEVGGGSKKTKPKG